MTTYLRSQIAKMANVSVETLRYYEDQGLISPQARSDAGYRLYPEQVLAELDFIKNAKSCGFTLKEIRKALVNSGSGSISIADFVSFIDRKVGKIEEEIARKEQTKEQLLKLQTGLLAAEKHPELHPTLRILHMEPGERHPVNPVAAEKRTP
jgi:DNA-binding transcriptional MerR regulator